MFRAPRSKRRGSSARRVETLSCHAYIRRFLVGNARFLEGRGRRPGPGRDVRKCACHLAGAAPSSTVLRPDGESLMQDILDAIARRADLVATFKRLEAMIPGVSSAELRPVIAASLELAQKLDLKADSKAIEGLNRVWTQYCEKSTADGEFLYDAVLSGDRERGLGGCAGRRARVQAARRLQGEAPGFLRVKQEPAARVAGPTSRG